MPLKVRIFDDPLVVPPEDIEMFYRSILHYVDSLENFAKWIDKQGNENAIKNVNEEVAEYRKLSLDLYDKFFSKHAAPAVERPNKVNPK